MNKYDIAKAVRLENFKNEDFSIWHWYYGYNKREAIKKFREDFGLKYKRLKLIFE